MFSNVSVCGQTRKELFKSIKWVLASCTGYCHPGTLSLCPFLFLLQEGEEGAEGL